MIAYSNLDASFSENFYGLKRRRRPWFETERAKAAVSGVFPGENLRTREVWRSLLLLVSHSVSFSMVRLDEAVKDV